jgi:hypothetical protein
MIHLMWQFDLHLEYDRDRVVKIAMDGLWEKYSGERPIVIGNPLGLMLAWLHRSTPGLPRDEFETTLRPGILAGIEQGEASLPEVHAQAKEALAGIKLLCFSEVFDNILMWAHYSRAHTGAVLRFSCIEELDSAWGAARPVTYQTQMPCLLDERQTIELFTGQRDINEVDLFESSVLTKAIDWAYEKEWRIIGGRNPKVVHEDIPFN